VLAFSALATALVADSLRVRDPSCALNNTRARGAVVVTLSHCLTLAQAPHDLAAFNVRCSDLYPHLFRVVDPASGGVKAAAPPPAWFAAHNATWSSSGERSDGSYDFDRRGVSLAVVALALGMPSFFLPLVVGNMVSCTRYGFYCRCNSTRGAMAFLCQVLGWCSFIYFCVGMGSAMSWQATISCGCSRSLTQPYFVSRTATVLYNHTNATAAWNASSSSSSTSTSTSTTTSTDAGAENGTGSCQSSGHDMLPNGYIPANGSLCIVATAFSLCFLVLVGPITESQRRMSGPGAGAGNGASGAVQMNPMTRLPPIIVAVPWTEEVVVGVPAPLNSPRTPSGLRTADGDESGALTAVGMPAAGNIVAGVPLRPPEVCIGMPPLDSAPAPRNPPAEQ